MSLQLLLFNVSASMLWSLIRCIVHGNLYSRGRKTSCFLHDILQMPSFPSEGFRVKKVSLVTPSWEMGMMKLCKHLSVSQVDFPMTADSFVLTSPPLPFCL